MVNQSSMGGGWIPAPSFSNRTISGASPATVTVPMQGAPLPATCQLNSSDANRSIKVSCGGNISTQYFTPVYDQSYANGLVVVLAGSVTHVQFTGTTGDTWSIT